MSRRKSRSSRGRKRGRERKRARKRAHTKGKKRNAGDSTKGSERCNPTEMVRAKRSEKNPKQTIHKDFHKGGIWGFRKRKGDEL